MKVKVRNKEISWLSFNGRVLQEAANPEVPLHERIKFLGIYSSNLDEFFRVRVATLKRFAEFGPDAKTLYGHKPKKILKEIQKKVLDLNHQFNEVYQSIVKELTQENIYIINEKELTRNQVQFVKNYFQKEVRNQIFPIMIDQLTKFPILRDKSSYLLVCLSPKNNSKKKEHALIELPTDTSRFIILPRYRKENVILLDDVIRYNLSAIFPLHKVNSKEAYTIKFTKDAELDIEDDLTQSVIKKVSRGLRQRKVADAVRLVYDKDIPQYILDFIVEKTGLSDQDTFVPGSRYHNFKDFIGFPDFGLKRLKYNPLPPVTHKRIDPKKSLFKIIKEKDLLLHYPYQSFDVVIDLLREASIDPSVESIKITLYRVAKNSGVANALMNAAKNGKDVIVVLELQARFDEAANIYWANRLQEEGVKVIYGVEGLKVHAKLCLITRLNKNRFEHTAIVGTGNFNEDTSRLYSDHHIFTADERLTDEVEKIFDFFEKNYKVARFNHLIVSPFNMRQKISEFIKNEIKNAKAGKPAYITLKLNNLVDTDIVTLLYEASNAGVKVRLMIRGMFSVITGVPGMSENIEAYGIIDRYLEHTRIYVFANGGDELMYITSADLMSRNIDRRVEVTCPVYDPDVRNELNKFLEIHWKDNCKARILNETLDNKMRKSKGAKVQAQLEIYDFIKRISS